MSKHGRAGATFHPPCHRQSQLWIQWVYFLLFLLCFTNFLALAPASPEHDTSNLVHLLSPLTFWAKPGFEMIFKRIQAVLFLLTSWVNVTFGAAGVLLTTGRFAHWPIYMYVSKYIYNYKNYKKWNDNIFNMWMLAP